MATDLTPEQRDKLTESVCAGRKIQAIKNLRDWTGLGLKEAKDIIDRMESDLRAARPERFAQPRGDKRRGCLLVVLVAIVVTAILIFLLLRR